MDKLNANVISVARMRLVFIRGEELIEVMEGEKLMKMINWFSGLDLPFALVPCLATIHLQFLFHPGRGRCLTRRSQVPPTSHASA